jgi:hypothetical protein
MEEPNAMMTGTSGKNKTKSITNPIMENIKDGTKTKAMAVEMVMAIANINKRKTGSTRFFYTL